MPIRIISFGGLSAACLALAKSSSLAQQLQPGFPITIGTGLRTDSYRYFGASPDKNRDAHQAPTIPGRMQCRKSMAYPFVQVCSNHVFCELIAWQSMVLRTQIILAGKKVNFLVCEDTDQGKNLSPFIAYEKP